MLFKRVVTSPGKDLPVVSRQGAGLFANLSIESVAADAAATLTTKQMAGGMIQYTGFTAGRVLTTPTALAILAECPEMDVGDSFSFIVSAVAAFAATWAAGVGVTLSGRATTPASSFSLVTVIKLSNTTVEWNVA